MAPKSFAERPRRQIIPYTYFSHCLAQLDLYRETGNARLLEASKEAIAFLLERNGMVVTGSCSHWECWHDTQSGLQNTSETVRPHTYAGLWNRCCAWRETVFTRHMERDIYNALFAATSPDGKRSRYFTAFDGNEPNDPNEYRQCCANKTNVSSPISKLGSTTERIGVAINLYSESSCELKLASGTAVRIEQHTDYRLPERCSSTSILTHQLASKSDFEFRAGARKRRSSSQVPNQPR